MRIHHAPDVVRLGNVGVEEDRFATGMAQIAGRFPPAARHAIPGGHEWPVWQQLWEHFLDLGHFAA